MTFDSWTTRLSIILRGYRARSAQPTVLIAALLVCLGFASGQRCVAHEIALKQTADGWQLLRDGQPYYVRGAGGLGSLAGLSAAGANSNRTWGVGEQTRVRLDEAERQGISVAVGIWLEHERLKKLDYSNAEQVEAQAQQVLGHVRDLKNHPAVLVWGIGNEMEGDGSNVAIWKHIEDVARRVKEIDPNHPTMTVIAEMGETKIQSIHEHCPSIDIIGINSYGGSKSVPERYRTNGGTKPYIVTEFGPIGTWEVKKNDFEAIEEASTGDKVEMYRGAYQAFAKDEQLCLGSYAFLWGNKQEATATWFGMLLPDGKRLATANAMSQLWSGKAPKNQCPVIKSLKLAGHNQVLPGTTVEATLEVVDAEGDELQVRWELVPEADSYVTGGDFQETPPSVKGAFLKQDSDGAEIKLPSEKGIYRLYVYVEDEKHQNAASWNLPLFVTASPTTPIASDSQSLGKLQIPFAVYDEAGQESGYVPSGLMGSVENVVVDASCDDDPKFGKTCLRCNYRATADWAGLVWQSPANDWGDLPGGFDLTGAKQLTFWAKGKVGGEQITFGYGLLGSDKKYPDSSKQEIEVTLTSGWKEYVIDCGADLTRIKSGFYWSLAGQGEPIEFFLDRVRYR